MAIGDITVVGQNLTGISCSGNYHGEFSGEIVDPLTNRVPGYLYVGLDVETLEEARTNSEAAGKTIVVNVPLTEAQSNILAAWPADRALKVEKGGSINPTTAFTGLPYAEVEWFGGGTNTANTNALQLAIMSSNNVYVNSGNYDQYNIVANDKIITMAPGVVFIVPDNSVVASSTSGPAALELSGDNITINGDFTCDGNSINQDISGFTTSNFDGTFSISGDNARVNGRVTIRDAYFVGVALKGGDTAGSEVKNVYINDIYVTNSYQRSVALNSIDGFTINKIVVVAETGNYDPRIRFGTGDGVTSECKNGVIGSITTNDSVIFEQKSRYIKINSITAATGKFEGLGTGTDEDTYDIYVDRIKISGVPVTGTEYYGWAFNSVKNITVNDLVVTGYDSPTPRNPVYFNKTKNSFVRSIRVSNNKTSGHDVRVQDWLYLTIGSVECTSPESTSFGFATDTDASYPYQIGLDIGSIYSTGHSVYDVVFDTMTESNRINVGRINIDAKSNRGSVTSIPGISCKGMFTPDGVGGVTSTGASNVGTVIENAIGVYTITFTTPIPNVTSMIPKYSVIDDASGGVIIPRVHAFSTTAITLRFAKSDGTLLRPDKFTVEIAGT